MHCSACQKEIRSEYLKTQFGTFHPQCFTCSACHKQITGRHVEDNNKPYHLKCLQIKNHQLCEHCHKPLGATWKTLEGKNYHAACVKHVATEHCPICGEGLFGKIVIDPWGNRGCYKHRNRSCGTCGRLIGKQTSLGGAQYDDGRIICGYCRKSTVLKSWEIQQAKNTVLTELKKVGFKNIPQNVGVNAVSRDELKQRSKKHFTKGLTLTQTKTRGSQVSEINHAIYILYGLPKIEFLGVLAHEFLHVWLNQNQIKWSLKETEGFCNLGSWLMYQQFPDDELAQYLNKQLFETKDRIYGDGFRLMYSKLEKLSWEGLIDFVDQNPKGEDKLSIFKKLFS